MTSGTPILGYRSITAAVTSLREADVPLRLIRALLEQSLGRLDGARWHSLQAKQAGGVPEPLTAAALDALAARGWRAAPKAGARRIRCCLGCRPAFASTGPGHRFCDACRARQASAPPGFAGVGW